MVVLLESLQTGEQDELAFPWEILSCKLGAAQESFGLSFAIGHLGHFTLLLINFFKTLLLSFNSVFLNLKVGMSSSIF